MNSHDANVRIRNLIWCFSPIVICLLLQLVAGFMAGEVAAGYALATFSGDSTKGLYAMLMSDEGVELITAVTGVIYSAAGIAVFGVMYALLFVKKDSEYQNTAPLITKGRTLSLSFRGYNILFLILGALLLIVGLNYVCSYVIDLISTLSPKMLEDFIALEEAAGITDDLSTLTFLYVVILGPIVEELAFRGVTFEYARRAASGNVAVVVQAILFAALHMNAMQMIYTFIVGLAFGYLAAKTGNILIPIAAHILYNGSQLLLSGNLKTANLPIVVFFTIVASLCAVYGGVLLIGHAAPKDSQVDTDDNAENANQADESEAA